MDGRALLVAVVTLLLLGQQATALVLTNEPLTSEIAGEISTDLAGYPAVQAAEAAGTAQASQDAPQASQVVQTAQTVPGRPLEEPPVVRWTRTYGAQENERAFAAVRVGDGYAFGGSTNSIDNVSGRPTDMWVVRVDSEGDRVWSRTIGTSGSEAVRDLVATEDGGLLVVGELGPGRGSRIVTLDAEGSIQDSWLFGTDRLARAATRLDGQYVIVGSVRGGEGFARPGAIAFATSGDDVNITTYTGRTVATETFTAVTQTANGDIVAVGFSDRGEGDVDAWAVRLAPDGTVRWNERISDPSGELRPAAVAELPNGDLVVAGAKRRGNVDDGWLARLDGRTGRPEWRTDFARLSLADVAVNGRGVLVVGDDFTNRVTHDAILLSVDGQGNEQWRETYGGPANDAFSALVPTDTGYLLVGWSDTGAAQREEFLVVSVSRPVTVGSVTVSAGQVAPGEEVTVTARLENRGEERKQYQTTLFVDGEARETQTRMVAVGNETTVTFTLAFEEPGSYAVGVDEAGPVSVQVRDPSTPTATPEPTTSAEPTPEPTPAPTTAEPTETTSPGLGAVVAVAALVAAALLLRLRSRRD